MIFKIDSKENKVVKHTKKLNQAKYRKKYLEFSIEGLLLVKEAILSISNLIKYIVITDKFLEKNQNFIQELNKKYKIYLLNEKIFIDISDVLNPQGIIIVARKKEDKLDLSNSDFFIVLDSVTNPGNLGTILRTAEASGVCGAIFTGNCVDPYSPKVVRASMGSIFRIKISENIKIEELKNADFRIMSSCLDKSSSIIEQNFQGKIAIVIGNEINGVGEETKKLSDFLIKIPMFGHCESLNAAEAASILIYFAKLKRENII